MEKTTVKWVSDIIGKEYEDWNRGQVVVVSAQTGTGKTSFVLNQLLPFAIAHQRKILYLCNRTALVKQIQKKLLQHNIPCDGMKKGRKGKKEPSQEQTETYIKVISYQKSEFISIKAEIYKFDAYYCIFDEAHYYYQDSQLNTGTQKISTYLFTGQMGKAFSSCVNVFMSATDDYVYLLLDKYYGKNFTNGLTIEKAKKHLIEQGILVYSTVFDYSYLNPYYFSDYREILSEILSTPLEEKWLVFVSSLKKSEELMEMLNVAGYSTVHSAKDTKEASTCAIVSRKTKSSYTYKELIVAEKFSCRVLLATSVIDNGVNIDDLALKHIVVPAVMKTQFLQLVGRKRIDRQKEERVNLYLQGFQKNSVNAFLRIARKKEQFIEDFNIRNEPERYRRRYINKIKEQGASEEVLEAVKKNDALILSYYQQHLSLELKTNPSFRNLLAVSENDSSVARRGSAGRIFPEWEINMLAEFQIGMETEFYGTIQEQLKDMKDVGAVNQQLGWLGLEYNENRWLSGIRLDAWKKDMWEYLPSLQGLPMDQEQQQAFVEHVTDRLKVDLGEGCAKIPNGKNGIHKLFIQEDIPFHIKCVLQKGTRKTLWVIENGLPQLPERIPKVENNNQEKLLAELPQFSQNLNKGIVVAVKSGEEIVSIHATSVKSKELNVKIVRGGKKCN